MNNQGKDGLLDSFVDAVSFGNIISKIVQFLFFGLVTATPYVVKNLDNVAIEVQSKGVSGIMVVWAYLSALFDAMWTGVGIGLSTVFTTIIKYDSIIADRRIGTIIFTIIVMIFSTLMIYQPTRLIFNILDAKKGRVHSKTMIMIISAVIMIVVASPIAYFVTGGDTITSGITDEPININETINIENTTISEENVTISGSLDMLTGGK